MEYCCCLSTGPISSTVAAAFLQNGAAAPRATAGTSHVRITCLGCVRTHACCVLCAVCCAVVRGVWVRAWVFRIYMVTYILFACLYLSLGLLVVCTSHWDWIELLIMAR
jgi:hypothetical protein